MWKYIRQYLPYAILAGLFMIGEVSMDLIQPGLMSQIVDKGVLGLDHGGVGNQELIWKFGTGSLVTRVTNDITQVQNFISQFVRGMIRTSALDLKTEANLYQALQKSNPQSTKIIIAQRIASVRRADRIAVLDKATMEERYSNKG